MATRTFILADVSTTPPYKLKIGGTTYEWGDFDSFKRWFKYMPDIAKLDEEVMLRWMLGLLWDAVGQDEAALKTQLNNRVGHTIEYTEPSIADLGAI